MARSIWRKPTEASAKTVTRNGFTIGDRVTCRVAVQAYYSQYNGNPTWEFKPGMVGVIATISPKVSRLTTPIPPRYDASDEMLVVDYLDGDTQRRCSLNFINARRVN